MIAASVTPAAPVPEPERHLYAQASEDHVRYSLSSDSDSDRPQVKMFVAPYYPAELLEQKQPGEVVLDIQVTNEGTVGGIWLVSATPDIFGTLATAAIRQWRFEPIPAKIRVVLEFLPQL